MNKIISCPKCGYQYLPGEIYDPKYFLGQPKNIVRNNIGEILGYEGIVMDPDETFICEHCGEEFKVSCKTSFSVITENGEICQENIENYPEIHKVSLFE